MTPATAELQRASLAIALDATYRAMEKPRKTQDGRCPECGGWVCPDDCPHSGDHDNYTGDPQPTRDGDDDGHRDDEGDHTIERQLLYREDEELFRCLTCEDTCEIEIQQRNSAGQAFREPWATETIACPDCNRDGAR